MLDRTGASQFCDCAYDGYCPRYHREMGGRMRELCAGVNVDLGTAAAFREQWAREAGVTTNSGDPISLLLKTDQAPGDAVCMTAAIYSLHRAHPGKYVTAIESSWPEVFAHNPDVANNLLTGGIDEAFDFAQADDLHMHYPAIHHSNERAIHFMQAWCEHLGRALGVQVPLLTDRPRLYFADPDPECGDYWVVCSGGKRDFTNKLWGHHNYQEVVDRLYVPFVQVGSKGDDHIPLRGAVNLVGETTLRGLFEVVRRARGVLCGVSLLMHVAAALEKPAVVVAGGRESVAWNAYPLQHYVHTVGSLPCNTAQGHVGGACWRSRVVPLGDGTLLDDDTCLYPVNGTPKSLSRTTVPKCMSLVRPEEVAGIILRCHQSLV